MNDDELRLAVRTWLNTTPEAGRAADWLLDRAEAGGIIPKKPTLDVTVTWQSALASFFSTHFVRLSDRGHKFTVYFDRWELEHFGKSGVLLPVLAKIRGRTLANRKQQRQQRESQIRELLDSFANDNGLPGHVARSELEKLNLRQGRFWSRSSRWSTAETERQLARYFKLLRYAEGLRRDASRIERIVHVSRIVAGDTHWLRPRKRAWRDLAEDILDFDAELKTRLNGMGRRETLASALADIGMVENLTSVLVLVYGHFALQHGAALWNWPIEAASERLPIWLTAVHLKDSCIIPISPITRVISIENETSFLDLIEREGEKPGVVLVYSEGQANRAVVAILRLLSMAAPLAQFEHQGDLDLPGVRILSSLCARTGLLIQPAYMDAETHRRFAKPGIQIDLTDAEHDEVVREVVVDRLPCRDLLEQIAATRVRIEQESITAVDRDAD